MRDILWIARRVDVAMAHAARPCLGGECDEYDRCRRHARTAELAARVCRMRERRDAWWRGRNSTRGYHE